MNRETQDRKNLLAVNLSLAVNVLLAGLKIAFGILGRSPALLADGINSTCDVAYLIVVRVFMRLAGEPPDREHPYGHRQLESIAAVVVGAFVVATAFAIFWNAIGKVYDLFSGRTDPESAAAITLWVALLTVVSKIYLTVFTSRIGRDTGSIAVLAVARDHRNDIFSISVAMIGIIAARMGYAWVDPAAAALVAAFIFHTGLSVVLESSSELMNVCPGEEMVGRLRGVVDSVEGVDQVEDVLIHRIGYYLLIDVTIGIDGRLSVVEGDKIATRVERAIEASEEYVRRVLVHYHPSNDIEGD